MSRACALLFLVVLLVAAGCGSTAARTGAAPRSTPAPPPSSTPVAPPPAAPVTAATRPVPSAAVVGPAAVHPAPVLAATADAWTRMALTRYEHREKVDRAARTYYFDCVGATSTFLKAAAPAANAELLAAEHVRRGYVPSPRKYTHFLRSLPAGGTAAWQPVPDPSALVGGEIVVVPPRPGTTTPGHAMVAAGPAEALADGSYALLVYDSTGTPHGDADTRRTDPRNLPILGSAPPRPSGLGRGTVQLGRLPGRTGWFMWWTVGGRRQYGDAVVIGRPLA